MPCLPQYEKSACGTRKVKYTPSAEWDLAVETRQRSIDLTLVLPHYRARNQPIDHRMAMLLASDAAPIKAKIVSSAHHIPDPPTDHRITVSPNITNEFLPRGPRRRIGCHPLAPVRLQRTHSPFRQSCFLPRLLQSHHAECPVQHGSLRRDSLRRGCRRHTRARRVPHVGCQHGRARIHGQRDMETNVWVWKTNTGDNHRLGLPSG